MNPNLFRTRWFVTTILQLYYLGIVWSNFEGVPEMLIVACQFNFGAGGWRFRFQKRI